jgi:hypothetical protein
VASLAAIGTCQGQSIVNVWHFRAPAANEAAFASDADRITWATGLATDWRTNVRASYLGIHTTDYSLLEIRTQVLETPGQFERRLTAVSDTTGAPSAGTIGASIDDMTTAVVVKWRTAIASRHTRGRSYYGPVEQGSTDVGKLVAASALDNALTTHLTAMSRYINGAAGVVAGFEQVVYSRPYSAPKGAYTRRVGGVLTIVNSATDFDGMATPVTAASKDTILRTQRRREIGVGS